MLLKRFACPVCGATGPVPTQSPFLQCSACNTIADFDWAVARQCPGWADHEALGARLLDERKAAFVAAGKAGNTAAWARTYHDMLEQLVAAFPSLYPKRIAEPAYRDHFIAFMVAHQARLATDKKLIANQRRITHASMAIERKNKRAVLDSLWKAIEVSLAHFDAQDRLARELPPGPPPDFAVGYMRQVGISLVLQEWLPLLAPADRLELVTRLRVAHQYVEETSDVHCNTCGAELPTIAVGETRTHCPYCHAEIHVQRGGRTEAQRAGDRDFISGELEMSLREVKARLEAIEILDGPTQKLRRVTLRARFAGRIDAFYEVVDEPSADAIASAFAWAKAEGERRGVAVRTIPYREHPRCASLPADLDELDRRLADALPGATRDQLLVSRFGSGFSYEVDVGGTLVRLAADIDGSKTDVLWHALRPNA